MKAYGRGSGELVSSKNCSKCGKIKPVSRFAKDTGNRTGRKSYCSKCANQAEADASADLSDRYVKRIIRQLNPDINITPEMIEEKRFWIKAKRLVNAQFGEG